MINPDQWVYLIDNRGEQRILKLQKAKKFRWRKKILDLTKVLAYPYNTVFKVDQSGNISKETNPDVFYFTKEVQQDDSDSDQSKDNRDLVDQNTSQKLTQDDIHLLKAVEEGDDIVKKLIQNSETFNQKTQYSQAKYLDKKKNKYIFYFAVEEVTLNKLQKCWYADSPGKINYLRIDALGLFIQLSGITPDSNILFFENTYGLALAGILQRAAPSGQLKVVFSHMNKSQLKDLLPLSQMNFKEEIKLVKQISVEQILKDDKFTHLLISGEFKYIEILENCLDQLEQGGTLVIYSSFLETLTEVAEYLISKNQYSQALILDSFMREQQVLPNRTHPKVEMNAFSGYLLQAYKLE